MTSFPPPLLISVTLLEDSIRIEITPQTLFLRENTECPGDMIILGMLEMLIWAGEIA